MITIHVREFKLMKTGNGKKIGVKKKDDKIFNEKVPAFEKYANG